MAWWRLHLRGYFVCLVLVPAMAWWLAFVLATWPLLWRLDPSPFGAMMDFGYDSAGRNDDVVIFGDSAALYGVNPKLLERQLGVKVVNLPNTVGSLSVIDDWNLRHYLAGNRAPRAIVFYFTAWDLDYANDHRIGMLFEGEELLLRTGTRAEWLGFARKHPGEVLRFPLRYYEMMAKLTPAIAAQRTANDRELAAMDGHLDDRPAGNAADRRLDANCEIPGYLVGADGLATAQALMARYGTDRTRVMVYVAPLPPCVGAAAILARSFAGVGAEAPKLLPLQDFKDDESYAHLDPAGVPEATRELGEALRPLLR